MYLDVIVVFAREPHGQVAFGLGAAIPQPTHFRGELQVLDRQGTAGGGWRAHHVKTQEEVNVGGGGGGGGNRNKGKRRQSDQGKNKVTKHRELITSIESEALLLVKGVIAVLDEWTLIRRGRWRGKGVQAVFGRNIKEAKSVTAPPGC